MMHVNREIFDTYHILCYLCMYDWSLHCFVVKSVSQISFDRLSTQTVTQIPKHSAYHCLTRGNAKWERLALP